MSKKKIKALGLLSGGLDSTVATKILQKQGIEVMGVNFSTGFCISDHTRALHRKNIPDRKLRSEALRAGADLDVKIDIIDLSKKYFKDVVLNPKHGYGAGMNPCLDCRIYMLKKAKRIMKKVGAQFVYTGEVLGQRPMSQYRKALDLISEESGLGNRLLRPLSAQRLPETLPEKMGWVNREELKGIEGRTRTEQIELANDLGLTDFPQPAGGCCYLPDQNFAIKLRDLLKHQKKITKSDLILLKVGRHFRISPQAKLIVGRDEAENKFLERPDLRRGGRGLMAVMNTHGPTALIQGNLLNGEKELAAQIVARYADATSTGLVEIFFKKGKEKVNLSVTPLKPEEVEKFRILHTPLNPRATIPPPAVSPKAGPASPDRPEGPTAGGGTNYDLRCTAFTLPALPPATSTPERP